MASVLLCRAVNYKYPKTSTSKLFLCFKAVQLEALTCHIYRNDFVSLLCMFVLTNVLITMISRKEAELKNNIVVCLVQDFENQNRKAKITSHNPDNSENVFYSCGQLLEMESVIVEDLIKPFTFQCNYFHPFLDTIVYSYKNKCCLIVKGSLIRKLICVLWQLLVVSRVFMKTFPGIVNKYISRNLTKGNNQSPIAFASDLVYTSFTCAMFYVCLFQSKNICAVFNHVLYLGDKLHVRQQSPPRIKAVKCAVHLSWIFEFLYIILTAVLYALDILLSPVEDQEVHSSSITLAQISNATKTAKVVYPMDFTDINWADCTIILRGTLAFAGFLNIFNWTVSMFHFGIWGLLLRQLFGIFYWRIHSMEDLERNIVLAHEIRTFNKIGTIVDDLNQIYGVPCVLGVVLCLTYVSTTVKHAISGLLDIPHIGSGWHLMLSYFPMIVATLCIAEVHRVAKSFAGIIKKQFSRLNEKFVNAAECLCGIAIVHYDLTTSSIGIKGLSFFTVSYQFVTTILSAVISYSIMVSQLFPDENVDNGV